MSYCCRRSSANRLRASRSPSGAMRPLPSRKFMRLRRNAEYSTPFAFRPTRAWSLGDRRHLVSAAGKALPEALGARQEFSLSGGELVEGEADRCQGRASPGRAVPAGRIHRDEHELAKPLGGALPTKARHAEQWIKQGKQATHWTRLSCHRFRANGVRLQLCVRAYNLGNLWRRLGLPHRIKSWSLTSLQPQVDEDRRSAGQARAVLLAAAGRRPSEPQAVRRHAASDLGAAAAKRVALTGRGATVFGSKRFRKEQCRPERRSARSSNVCERMDEPWRLPAEGHVRGSARKDVVFGAARVYTFTVPGPKWESWFGCPNCTGEARILLNIEGLPPFSLAPAGAHLGSSTLTDDQRRRRLKSMGVF